MSSVPLFRNFCNLSMVDNQNLLQHIQIVHPEERVFRCWESKCQRSFSVFRSFRKHRFSCHDQTNFQYKNTIKKTTNEEKITEENLEHVTQNNLFSNSGNIANILNESDDNEFHSTIKKLKLDAHMPVGVESPESSGGALDSEMRNNFAEEFELFVAKLYSILQLPRVIVTEIIQDVKNLLKALVNDLQFEINDNDENKSNIPYNNNLIQVISDLLLSSVDKFSSEQRSLTVFKKNNTFVAPESVKIGERQEFQERNETTIYKTIPVTIEIVSLRHVSNNSLNDLKFLRKR